MSQVPTEEQVSAGGVVFRAAERLEVALIKVAQGTGEGRWQLPKGLVDARETPEDAARREVREETGLETELLAPLDTIEYWYVGRRGGRRLRFHKLVHFFLFRYLSGSVDDHDHEVEEARWVDMAEAERLLSFANERAVVHKAREAIRNL